MTKRLQNLNRMYIDSTKRKVNTTSLKNIAKGQVHNENRALEKYSRACITRPTALFRQYRMACPDCTVIHIF